MSEYAFVEIEHRQRSGTSILGRKQIPALKARALIAGEAVIVPREIINEARCFMAGLEGVLDHLIKAAGKDGDKKTAVNAIRERTEVREFRNKLKAITKEQ